MDLFKKFYIEHLEKKSVYTLLVESLFLLNYFSWSNILMSFLILFIIYWPKDKPFSHFKKEEDVLKLVRI